MTGIDSWSPTPAMNATADAGAINWAEGMPSSAVNNTSRQMCADIRSAFNDIIWFEYSTGDQDTNTHLAVPAVYSSGTAFTITGADVTAVYHAGRPLRAVGVSTGTIYGAVTSSTYNSGNSTTTVNAAWDSGSLANETLVISISQVPVTGTPVSGPIRFPATQISSSNANVLDDYEEGTWTPADGSGASLSFTSVSANYVKIGRVVHVWAQFTYPSTADGSNNSISGLPFTALNSGPGVNIGHVVFGGGGGVPGTHANYYASIGKNTSTVSFLYSGGSVLTNAELSLFGVTLYACYQATT